MFLLMKKYRKSGVNELIEAVNNCSSLSKQHFLSEEEHMLQFKLHVCSRSSKHYRWVKGK